MSGGRRRRTIGRRPRAGDDPHELGEAIESSDALRLRLVMWLARSHGRTARARAVAPPAPEAEVPPTVRRRRRPRS
jgi:hypothetical protein